MKHITKWSQALAIVCTGGLAGCAQGIEPPKPTNMVEIPAGTFAFGQDPDLLCGTNGTVGSCSSAPVPVLFPQVNVQVPAFAIDEHEVTNFQYEYCVAAGGCEEPEFGNTQNRENYYGEEAFRNFPVVNVTWQQAINYCKFIDPNARLPSEVEWERVAKGPSGDLVFPSSVVTSLASPSACPGSFNIQGCDGNGNTDPVGGNANDSIDWGTGTVFDMTGNVSEWTSSPWASVDLTCAGAACADADKVNNQCITCAAPADPQAECYEQCNTYPCLAYKDSVTLSESELLPDNAADKAYRGANVITPKGQLCTMLAGDRSQRNGQTRVQNFLGFRCAKSL